MKARNLSEESLHLCLEGNTIIEVKQNEIVELPEWVFKMLQSTARLERVEEKKVVEVKEEPKEEIKEEKKIFKKK